MYFFFDKEFIRQGKRERKEKSLNLEELSEDVGLVSSVDLLSVPDELDTLLAVGKDCDEKPTEVGKALGVNGELGSIELEEAEDVFLGRLAFLVLVGVAEVMVVVVVSVKVL